MRRLSTLLLFAVAIAAVCSCNKALRTSAGQGDTLAMRHARLITVVRHDGFRIATVADPWNKGKVLHTYILLSADSAVPKSLPKGTLLRVPLSRSVVSTSVHCALFNELGALGQVVGLCDVRYVLDKGVLQAVKMGAVRDMGSAMTPDVERILKEKPDALFLSPFQGSGGYGRISQTGLPIVECADYMESSPLARAEWMRFYGMLFGCERRADSLFAAVESAYAALRARASRASSRPTLMADHIDGDAWYMPGGESTLGQMFKDAGGRYLFGDNRKAGSVRFSMESVMKRALNADIWLVKYGKANDYTYASLRAEREQYAYFLPWRKRRIYGCNTLRVPFFDREPFHPELLLSDLVQIFHPELGIHRPFNFYTPLSR